MVSGRFCSAAGKAACRSAARPAVVPRPPPTPAVAGALATAATVCQGVSGGRLQAQAGRQRQQRRAGHCAVGTRVDGRRQSPAVAAASAGPAAAAANGGGGWGEQQPQGAQQQALLAALVSAPTPSDLASLVGAHAAELEGGGELCAMALLAATQLAAGGAGDGPEDGEGDGAEGDEEEGGVDYEGEGDDAAAAEVELQGRLLDRLADALAPTAAALPPATAAALALALANAGYYHERVYAGAAAGAAAALPGLPDSEVPVVATALAAGFGAAGHYEEGLFEALAQRAVSAHAAAPWSGPTPLLAVAGGLLEAQHYSPALLDALCGAVREAGAAALPPAQLADLLLVLGFFGHAPDDVVAPASAALAAALRQQQGPGGGGSDDSGSVGDEDGALDEGQLDRLSRAALLLAARGVPVDAGLTAALASRPPAPLLAADHLVWDPEDAAAALAQPQGAEWEAAGLLAPAQVVARLGPGGLGYDVEWGAVAGEPGAPRAVVDACISVDPTAAAAAAAAALGAPSGGGEPGSSSGASSSRGSGGAAPRRVAVAVLDEEACYCAHPPGRLRGGIAAQVLALQSLGWSVLPLPVREWRALGGDAAAQEAYLRGRIAAAVG